MERTGRVCRFPDFLVLIVITCGQVVAKHSMCSKSQYEPFHLFPSCLSCVPPSFVTEKRNILSLLLNDTYFENKVFVHSRVEYDKAKRKNKTFWLCFLFFFWIQSFQSDVSNFICGHRSNVPPIRRFLNKREDCCAGSICLTIEQFFFFVRRTRQHYPKLRRYPIAFYMYFQIDNFQTKPN